MRKWIHSGKACSEKGQSLVETAFVLPVLILLLAIAIDASRAFDALIVLTNAVRQGARYASLEPGPDQAQIKQMVVDDVVGSGTNITNMADFGQGNVTVEVAPAVAVTVTASYDFPLWFGGILGLPTLPLEKSAVIRHTEANP
jgi:Flp pilus assembly protein TadG